MFRANVLALSACGRIGFGEIASGDAAADIAVDAEPPPIMLAGTTAQAAHAPAAVETVTLPAGIAAGDLLLLAFYADLVNANAAPPSGWQMRLQYNEPNHLYQATYFYRVAGASEPASYDFTISNSDSVAWALVAYRGVSAAAPVDVDEASEASPTFTPANVTYTGSSLVTTRSGDTLVLLVINDSGGGGAWTSPPDMTPRTPSSNFRTIIFDRALADPGATGDEAATVSVAGATAPSGAVWLVALSR